MWVHQWKTKTIRTYNDFEVRITKIRMLNVIYVSVFMMEILCDKVDIADSNLEIVLPD